MSDAVLAALITGALAVVCEVITILASNSRLQHKMEVAQAVTDTKLEELTREVRMHNGFAQKIPVLEEKMAVANHRITDLEHQAEK